MNEPIILSIETDKGSYRHGFHLGTEPTQALQIAEEFFKTLEPKIGTYIKTVALFQGSKMIGCFDGVEWFK